MEHKTVLITQAKKKGHRTTDWYRIAGEKPLVVQEVTRNAPVDIFVVAFRLVRFLLRGTCDAVPCGIVAPL
jgi:hypothetical protein